MGYIAKLTRGASEIDLSSGQYALALDYSPPAANMLLSLAAGTSANRYGGGVLMGRRLAPPGPSLPVRVKGDSSAEVEAGIQRLARFLEGAGDAGEPTYFLWRPNDAIPFEPKHGQFGASIKVELLGAETYVKWDSYGHATAREHVAVVIIPLVVNPAINGKRMRAGSAIGGVLENVFTSPDGISRGLMIPEATINKSTNPVFGHATWNTGWTTGADLIASKNTDKAFILPGATASAKLTRATGGSGYIFYQSLNVGNTNTHTFSAYVKKADGTPATAADVRIIYVITQATTTYTYLGNGITRLRWTGAGIASSQITGVSLFQTIGVTVYLLAYQVEEKTYPTTICWGDLIGCSWTGTAHASTSTRTAARVRWPATDLLDIGEFTAVMVWMPDKNSSDFSGVAAYFLYDTVMAFRLLTANVYRLGDGTNIIDTSTVTFAAGDIEVLHVAGGPNGLRIYRNGTLAATGSSYTPWTLGTFLYLGSTAGPASQPGGTFLGFHTYARMISDAQALADYNNIVQAVKGGDGYGQRLETIPALWTKDGDDQVDNANPDADLPSNLDNYGILFGVPGDLPAETEIIATTSISMDSSNAGGVGLSILEVPHDKTLDMHDFYGESSGVADVGNSSDNAYEQVSVGTGGSAFTREISMALEHMELLAGRDIAFLCRIRVAAGGAAELRTTVYFGIDAGMSSDYQAIQSAALFLMRRTPFVTMPDYRLLAPTGVPGTVAGFYVYARRQSGGAANIDLDYYQIITRPFMLIDFSTTTSCSIFRYSSRDKSVVGLASLTVIQSTGVSLSGEMIEFRPGLYNYLISCVGRTKGAAGAQASISHTLTYNEIWVTPRWLVG